MSPHAERTLADLSPGRPNFGNSAAVLNRTEKLCKQVWQTSAGNDEAEDDQCKYTGEQGKYSYPGSTR